MRAFSLFLLVLAITITPLLTSPGLPWTTEETLIVKAKLTQMLDQRGGVVKEYLKLHPELGLNSWPEAKSLPNAAKMLRLGFHGCLKFSDGTGGCNGCLNNLHLGLDQRHNCSKGADNTMLPNSVKTDNSGLELTANMLEEIFTNRDFPKSAQKLSQSLAKTGKSRADLWNFAQAFAVERGIKRNNDKCDQTTGKCQHLYGKEPGCKLELTQPVRFFTGRSDCQPQPGLAGWETTQPEHHPNPHGNGQDTADFFKADFGLTGRESAALLLGAHSFGTFNAEISQFRYDWTRTQADILNNQLFRNVAMRPQYFGQCADKWMSQWHLVGDHLGQPAETRWKVVASKCSAGMGPFQWFHQYYRCPASNSCSGLTPNQTVASRHPITSYPAIPKPPHQARAEPVTDPECCEDLAPGLFCQPSCVRNIQNDETALAVDMGYYLDFQVDPETGRPGGCDCFDSAKPSDNWRVSKIVDCPKQSYAPEGEPLHLIVEEYADNQDVWIKDFLAALDKMSMNGNDPSDLTEGPTGWFGAECKKQKVQGSGNIMICT